jgi:hypothetical protein
MGVPCNDHSLFSSENDMAKVVKTAVAIPLDDFKLIESVRKKSGKSRSQLLMEAFHVWMNMRRKEELEARYAQAYRAMPETLSDIEGLMEAGSTVWKKEDW